jgi:DNA-directed RNA polymerase beta subunit
MNNIYNQQIPKMNTQIINGYDANGNFVIENNPYIEDPWTIIESYFKDQHLDRLVRHQLESYNNFVGYQIIKTIEMFNPVHIKSEEDFNHTIGKYSLEMFITFENFHIYRPQIHENNGAIKLMFPQEARLRNFTYSSAMTIDINIKYIIRDGEKLDIVKTLYKTLPKIHIGKLPIMLKSNICVLNQYNYVDYKHTGECKYDAGGYFIINGSEKTVLGQERAAENRVYCFNISKNETKYTWKAEIKSVPDFKCISPKQINMMISSKNNGFGYPIYIEIPRIKQPIPLFILFRALNILSDKNICEYILLDITLEKHKPLLENLQASIIEANKYMTYEDSVKYITSFVSYTPLNMDKETGANRKRQFTLDVLQNDLFPHCKTIKQKIYFLGYMANKLLQASFEWIKCDDRDSYINKRIDLTGTSLNNLFRNHFNKLVKDMEKQVVKEIKNGSWKSKEDYINIINLTNIYKIIKSNTIENGFKRALSTGDFGIKHANSNKVGVAQVLNRLTYIASLSHLRRVSTPTDKSGKLVPPRKLHSTSWGFLCPAECFDPETEILMWDGQIKLAKNIIVGDILVDDLGNPTTVRTTCSGFKNMYDIIPNKQNFIKHRVTDNHILTLKIRGSLNYNEIEDVLWTMIDDKNTCDIKLESYINLDKTIQEKFVLFKQNHIDESNFNLVEVGMGPYVGWQLHDKRGRFCLKDGSVVHNTPEGASVGVVKNMSYMAHITIHSDSNSLYDYIMPNIIKIDDNVPDIYDDALTPEFLYNKVKVFINGAWVGVTIEPEELYNNLKDMKYKGIINIYTSIIFNYKLQEIRVCNDSGRITRPLLRVKNNNILLTSEVIQNLKSNELLWDDLLVNCKLDNTIIEYVDPEEQSFSMIANKPKDIITNNGITIIKYTHCEIHPSTIFGVVASCIPYPDHNQSPRNTYQCLDINETVLLSNGSSVPIKDIKIGDEVICFNPSNLSELSNTKVVKHFIIPNNNAVFEICLRQGKKIIATEDHKFMTQDGWCEVKNMKIHYTFIAILKENKIIYDIVYQITKVSDRLVSDITVESDNHSFITSGGILSSNCAQAKQAMGIYATNFNERMDKTAYVLSSPTRPLVDTRLMNFIKLNENPSGCNINVAIMTHTGYNQEDSLLVNKGSIDRGLLQITITHTEKDEDKQKINGDEEIRCKPDPSNTKGMKFGNYNKVNSKGIVPENTLIENRDVIIAKKTPIKENRNDPTKVIKYEDGSKQYKTSEETYIDKNYIDRNGDGYSFAKVRLRCLRKPVIGDKFCALPTQQVLTHMGWVEIQYIDISVHKVATLDVNGNMTYEYPSEKFEYEHNDKMYFVENKQVHIICTLNHKLYVQKRSGKNYELIEAQDVMGKMVRFQKSLKNVNEDIEFMKFGDEKYDMDEFLKLLGIFIADGCVKSDAIYITALKERKYNYYKTILENLNIKWTYHNCGNFYISKIGNTLSSYFSELSVGALNKYLPEIAFNLSEKQSRILLEALLEGDGSSMEYKGESFNRYGTISLQLANDVSRLAVHCGYSGIIKISEEPTGISRVGKRKLGSRAGQVVEITQKHTYYKVSIITKQNQPWINKKQNESNVEKLIDYEGKVYCIEMPSSNTYYMRETDHSPSQIIGNSSRHGQKGTVGNIIPEEDMPFTRNGVRPDIIINPHAIPSRMTIGQLKETLLGKVLVELGLFGDGTSFGELDVDTISKKLLDLGYEAHGNELMYNGLTGEQIECSVFLGPVFYQRLKHMVNDKQHSRSFGPMVNLTRQPAEGRSRDGGLRFGEMEKDAMVSHGASKFTRGRMYDASDKYQVYVCKKCGLIASYNDELHIHCCRTCDNRVDFAYVEIPYACKLLFQELTTMNVVPRIMTDK